MIRKATKKPVEIKWVSYEDLVENFYKFINDEKVTFNEWIDLYHKIDFCDSEESEEIIFITVQTLEGDMKMTDKDVLIIGVEGEMYPCKIDIFKKTYDYEGEL